MKVGESGTIDCSSVLLCMREGGPLMRARVFLASALLVLITACGGGGSDSPAPSAPPPGSASIAPGGGTVSLPSVAEFSFPPGAFAAATSVQLSQVATATLPQEYGFNTGIFYAQSALSNAVVITLGQTEPVGNVTAKITLPSSFIAAKPPNTAFAVIAATINASEFEGPYDTYELIDPVFNAASSQLTFVADASYFTQRDANNNVVGRFVVVVVPGPQKTN